MLQVTRLGSTQQAEVTLLHFSGWPNFNVPTNASQLAGFKSMINQLLAHYTAPNKDFKALVHCFKGHGRTGTTLTILSQLLQAYYG